MQDIPAPRKRDYSGRVYGPRTCEDCPAAFTPLSSGQKRCEECQRRNTLRLKREGALRKRKATYVPRYCADCGAELPPPDGSARPRVRCEPCAKAHRVAHDRERNRARTESGERKAYDKRYREDSRETIRASNRKYKQAHPETDLAAIHRRRQRRDHGMTDLDRLLSNAYRVAIRKDSCFYCGATVTQEDDHFFPLSKGGTDHWWNLVRTCKPCNRSKRNTCGTAFILRSGLLTLT